MNKQHFRRPRIQRAFESWFKKNSTRFAAPLRMTKIEGKGMELRFDNYPDCLFVEIWRNDLAVTVEWQGRWWDALLWEFTFPIITRGGYKYVPNRTDRNDPAPVFPSLEAMWQKHLFEPFLKWVNDKLAPARWLQISRLEGARWARLIRDEIEFQEDGKPFFKGDPEGYFECLVPLKPYINSKVDS